MQKTTSLYTQWAFQFPWKSSNDSGNVPKFHKGGLKAVSSSLSNHFYVENCKLSCDFCSPGRVTKSTKVKIQSPLHGSLFHHPFDLIHAKWPLIEVSATEDSLLFHLIYFKSRRGLRISMLTFITYPLTWEKQELVIKWGTNLYSPKSLYASNWIHWPARWDRSIPVKITQQNTDILCRLLIVHMRTVEVTVFLWLGTFALIPEAWVCSLDKV